MEADGIHQEDKNEELLDADSGHVYMQGCEQLSPGLDSRKKMVLQCNTSAAVLLFPWVDAAP